MCSALVQPTGIGELLMLLEANKRGVEHAVTPIYRRDENDKFHVPENLFFIGTMNRGTQTRHSVGIL